MPLDIKIKDVEEVLNQIKEATLKEIIDEFKNLLKEGLQDNSQFVKDNAKRLATWTVLLGTKQLTRGQYERLLKDQKSLAEQHVNSVEIAVRARIQKLAYRVLDIGIDIIGKAVVIG